MSSSTPQAMGRVDGCRDEGFRHTHLKQDARKVHDCGHRETISIWIEIRTQGHDDVIVEHLTSWRWFQTEHVSGGWKECCDTSRCGHCGNPIGTYLLQMAHGSCTNGGTHFSSTEGVKLIGVEVDVESRVSTGGENFFAEMGMQFRWKIFVVGPLL